MTVLASMYAVKTHEYCVTPPRSVTIRGSAVATIVWSNAARKSATISRVDRSAAGMFRKSASISPE